MEYIRNVDFDWFAKNDYHSQRLAGPGSGIESCIALTTYVPVGQAHSSMHIHPVDQFYYILKGKMNIQLGTKYYTADTNSLVYIPKGVPHINWNAGTEDEHHFELIVPQPQAGEPVAMRVKLDVEPTAAEVVPGSTPEYVRHIDINAFDMKTRFPTQRLTNRSMGSEHVSMYIARVPSGFSRDMYVHAFDQFYYIVSGVMKLQIGLKDYEAGPDSLVVLPAGVPHKNWNDGPEDEMHLALLVPEPEAGARADVIVRMEPR